MSLSHLAKEALKKAGHKTEPDAAETRQIFFLDMISLSNNGQRGSDLK